MSWRIPFVALALTWGTSFAFIKLALEDLAPIDVAFGRVALGALTLLALLVARRERLPRDKALWGHLFVVALLFNSVPFTLFAYGEERISSVLAGIFNATTPLLTALFGLLALRGERPTRAGAAGLALGFVGVVVVLGPWRGLGGASLAGELMVLGAAACYGLAFVYMRLHVSGRPESGVVLSAAQLVLATVQLGLVAPWVGAAPDAVSLQTVLSMLGLGCLGTGVAYVFNYAVVRQAGITTASTVTYVVPIVSTVLGVVALGELLRVNQPLGGVLVLLGVAISGRAAHGRARSPARAS